MAPELATEKASTQSQNVSDKKNPVVETLNVATEDDYRRPSEVSTPASSRMANPFDTDLEAMITSRTTREDDSCGMKSVSRSNLKGSPDGQVWPDQGHWKKKAKANKVNQRSCQCLAKMSKRNRILAKIGIILLVVAIGVGVGFGISKPLGAGIWKGNGE